MNELGNALAGNLLRNDPEIEQRITLGIEANRKSFASIELRHANGTPVERAKIWIRQLNHAFHFGCNSFMLEQFSEEDKNRCYEEMFANLFNLAVVPFYWSDLEPEDGATRFVKNSIPIYRRPPPDTVLDFCRRRDIVPKGHLLCWHEFVPAWLKAYGNEIPARLERRIREIAERYGKDIKIWDVANEALQWDALHRYMPPHHVESAFRIAEKFFPNATRMLYNEGPFVSWANYHGDYSPLYLLVKSLMAQKLKVDGLGLQYHMFTGDFDKVRHWADNFLNPYYLYATMDQYAKLGIPLNVSEISIAGSREFGDGDEFQELVAERLYRIWFSHPAMNGIIWWNLVDGTAAYAPPGSEDGENRYRAGLLNYDLSPKPAYVALSRLINQEWRSNITLEYHHAEISKFHGFFGDYEITIQFDGGVSTHRISLRTDEKNKFSLILE